MIAVMRMRELARPRLRAPRPMRVLAILATVALLGGSWLWLRDSALVSVNRVTVTGAIGPDAGRIRAALVAAGHSMTTLDVRMDMLRTAVRPFPVVKDLKVSTQFPHGIRIRVLEQVPVGAVLVGGRTIAVAGDGTLIRDRADVGGLPQIPLPAPPGGTRLTDAGALGAVGVLAAAPATLLARVRQVTSVAPHGLVAQLHGGPSIYLGDARRLAAKWAAARAVLADPGAVGAVYIDVTDPERAAAGGVGQQSGAAGSGSSQSSTGTAGSGGAPPSAAPVGG